MPTLRRPPKAILSQAHKNASFSDRLNAAAAAKKAALERFHTRPGPDDPAVREQQAARKAISGMPATPPARRDDSPQLFLACHGTSAHAPYTLNRNYFRMR